jgi:ferredoxin
MRNGVLYLNKEVVIICESLYHGNTMRLARAMAFRLGCGIMTAQEAFSADLSRFKVIGLGSGIYFTSHHPKLLEAVGLLNPSQKAFVFSTHGAPFLGRYHDALKEKLAERKITVLGEFSAKGFDCTGPFILVGGGNKGRPNERDEKRAATFVSALLPEYTGDMPDVPDGHFVHVKETCAGCLKCVSVCPMRVFELRDNKVAPVSERDCIHCGLCRQSCPANAIAVRHSPLEAIKIAKRHAHRKSL